MRVLVAVLVHMLVAVLMRVLVAVPVRVLVMMIPVTLGHCVAPVPRDPS
jgi:hypothetical protein